VLRTFLSLCAWTAGSIRVTSMDCPSWNIFPISPALVAGLFVLGRHRGGPLEAGVREAHFVHARFHAARVKLRTGDESAKSPLDSA
jgi:hypothetical protein